MSLLSKFKSYFVSAPTPAAAPEPVQINTQEPQVIDPRIVARYEGAVTTYGDRSHIPAGLQDARFDATPGVRMELARKSRYWERNCWIMTRLADLFEQYTVGDNGLRIIPNSGADQADQPAPEPAKVPAVPEDPSAETLKDVLLTMPFDWNKQAAAFWSDWCRHPEIDQPRNFSETQSLIARCWFVDGEIFILKTKDKTGPKIQLIESHRVATPNQLPDGVVVQDGVELDGAGRPVAYWVRRSDMSTMMGLGNTLYPYIADREEVFDRVPATSMIHVYESNRPGMTRGLPFNYSVLNELHDLEDLRLEEMKAVKSAAELATIWHTKTGEAPDPSNMRKVNTTVQTATATGGSGTKSNPIFYDLARGGRNQFLKPGEDVKQFMTERPTVATQQFWDYLVAVICAGCGISRLLVAPTAPAQGTVVRSDLDTNARFFLQRSEILQKFFVEIYVWVMGWAKDWSRDLRGAPADWDRVIIRPPRSVDVDTGRNSEARIAELNAGIRTRADLYAESGEDWKEQLEQIAREQAYVRSLAKRYNVPVESILAPPKSSSPAPVNNTPDTTTTEPQPQPKPVPVKVNGNGHVNGRVNGHTLDFVPSRL